MSAKFLSELKLIFRETFFVLPVVLVLDDSSIMDKECFYCHSK